MSELTTRQALAKTVLDGDDQAAAAALADYLLEEGLDWAEAEIRRLAEPIKEEAVEQERRRARRAAAEFRHWYEMNVGDGYGRYFPGDLTSRAFVMETLARLSEQAEFVRSGESLEGWEAKKRAEYQIAVLQLEFAQRPAVGRGYFELSHFVRESAGVIGVNDGRPPEGGE